MEQRTFDELISNFNSTISEWEIDLKYKFKLLGMIVDIGYEHEKMLNNLPSAEPKTGKWLSWKAYYGKDRKSWEEAWKCSACGYQWGDEEYKFCPMCGSHNTV